MLEFPSTASIDVMRLFVCLLLPPTLQRCRDIGIKCPIIPGYMVPPTYEVFNKFTAWCRSRIPRDLASALAETKFDDETVKKLVVKVCVRVSVCD